jgi:GMP synthase (glutamine-hydrolysing)
MESRVVAFCHVPHEPLGFIETILKEKNIQFEYVNLYETNEIPDKIEATHLIFLGGPFSVNDEKEFPWLVQEKELIRRSVKNGQKIFGICLGAQLIASAFGAKVFEFVNETGWHKLNRENDVKGIFSHFPDRFHVFEFHSEMFEIPCGGRLLAYGNGVHNQAFSFKDTIGVQFHIEVTKEIILDWSKNFPPDTRSTIIHDTQRFIAESNQHCRLVIEDFIN